MKLYIRESNINFDSKSNLTFVKCQADTYDILLDDQSVGTIWCKNYYSQPKNRIWNIDIELDNFREHGNAYTIAEAKAIAKDLWKAVFEKAKKWNEEMI